MAFLKSVQNITGRVIKATAGFYYVLQDNGLIWECALRGKFRLDNQGALVGDLVSLRPRQGRTGVIEQIFPRKNALLRPPVANIEQALIIFAIRQPELSRLLLDRFLLQAEIAGVEPIICLNKIDLADGEELAACYLNIGYSVFQTSVTAGLGLEALRQVLSQKISIVAGPSGVGKSSLLNALQPGLQLQTGEVGNKLKRGRHTTRLVEFFPLDWGGWVADTPGFSSLWLPNIKKENLRDYFPEFADLQAECRFRGCLHKDEPECAVKAAVESGQVDAIRYQNYLNFLEEIKKTETKY